LNSLVVLIANSYKIKDAAAIRNGALGIQSLSSQAKHLDREGGLCVSSAGF
jgi:hypothetical protein